VAAFAAAMRASRLPLALSLIGLFSLAGCSTAPLEGSATTPESVAATESAETKTATAEPEKKTEVAAEPRTAAPVSSTASGSSSRDDGANSTSRLIAQLNEATREIATLRATNAKLKAAPAPASAREPDPADAKLAASLKSYAQFKQELTGFFADVDKLRAENASLNAKLKDVASGSQDFKATLAKLEGDLKSEKTARVQAEQTAAKLREQLRAVAAAVSAPGLSLDKAPSDSAPTARLETSEARVRGAAAVRKHAVRDGDTLEKIADRYYGDPTKWRAILDANRGRLPLDGSLPSGLELEIPAK
jgi:nucleoid-associated protein YgaU